MAKSIDCDVYHDRVEIRMFGEAPITVVKPVQVPLNEWDSFWGAKRCSTPAARPLFTHEDVEANNRRRLANIPR